MGWSPLGTQFCLELGFGMLIALAFVSRAPLGLFFFRLMGSTEHRMEWTEGTLGARYRTPVPSEGKLGGATLLLYSDGISDRFEPGDYPGITMDEPSVAARNVVERFGKDYDDASCIVLRCRA